MIFKLKEKCLESSKKEFFYGNIVNKDIVDVYLGLGYLDAGETRAFCPGKGHEEIIYLMNGQIEIVIEGQEFKFKEGEAVHLSGTTEIKMINNSDDRIFFITAGGHTEPHH
ncbi:MAG: cupin domain-containing protein [Candidatus Helarchaeota archaeon]